MRRILIIAIAVVGAVVLVAAGLVLYAARNLNSIIAQNRAYVLARASDSLGRKVEVADIKVALGWGVMADLRDVKIGDDPAISGKPFVEAKDVYARVALIPLLARRIHVTELVLDDPEVRIIRTARGTFNISTLGKKRAGDPSQPSPGLRTEKGESAAGGLPLTQGRGRPRGRVRPAGLLAGLYVKAFTIRNGRVIYQAVGPKPESMTISDIALSVRNFGPARPFPVSLAFGVFSGRKNVDISGTVGPLAKAGMIDVPAIPFRFKATVGPLMLVRLRAVPALGKAIPEKLSMPDPVKLEAEADGTPAAIRFRLASDLTADHVAWGHEFDKPAAVPFTLGAQGLRVNSRLEIAQATVTLGELQAKAGKIKFGHGNLSARLDTNRFAIGPLAGFIPAAQKFNPSGRAEVHSDFALTKQEVAANGTVTLAKVSVSRPGAKASMVSNLDGVVKLHGSGADADGARFDLGSGHATLTVHARSLKPLDATYALSVDRIKLAELAPKRPAGEYLSQVVASGSVASRPDDIVVVTKASSDRGELANVDYSNLDVLASLAGRQLDLKSLKFGAFSGSVSADGRATIGARPAFALNLAADNINLQDALKSQKAKAADIVRGILNGRVTVAGNGSRLDEIKPTLHGNGRANLKDGKLIGVNIVAQALDKTKHLPAIGDLVPSSIVKNHPELFANPDTDLQNASLTFALEGPKISTNDLTVQTPDYDIQGKGWFDMDRKLDVLADIILSKPLTQEIIANKKNVVYVTNREGRIDVPLEIRGTLPRPKVLPNVGQLAQRAGRHVVEREGEKYLGKLFGRKGHTGGGTGPGSQPSPAKPLNPLEQLKKLF
jgi:AsmA-like C-terminal region